MTKLFVGVAVVVLGAAVYIAFLKPHMTAEEAKAFRTLNQEMSQRLAESAADANRPDDPALVRKAADRRLAQNAYADCVRQNLPQGNGEVRRLVDGMPEFSVEMSKSVLRIIEAEYGVSIKAVLTNCEKK